MSHSKKSRFREKMIECKFLSELFEKLWLKRQFDIEVSRPLVDDAGYDLVISSKTTTHFLQLKSKKKGGRAGNLKVHLNLFSKRNSGILLIEFKETDALHIILQYKYLNLQCVDPKKLSTAKHTKSNADGKKNKRPNIKVVKPSSLNSITIDDFIKELSHENK